jgi:hypothetical protein
MREHGEMYLSINEKVPLHGFILTGSDIEIHPGDQLPIDHLHPLLTTCDACKADKLFCIGIARREAIQGRDTLLMINPDTKIDI